MFENNSRLQELSAKTADGSITDEEFAELALLAKAKRKNREEHAAKVLALRDTLSSQGISIHELFSAEEIAVAAKSKGRLSQVVRTKVVSTPRSSATWVRQKSGLVLVEVRIEGLNGFPSKYCKGQPLPRYVSKGFKSLDDGQLEANLARY